MWNRETIVQDGSMPVAQNFAPIGFLYKIVLLSVLNTEVARTLRRGKGAISSGEGAKNRIIDFE